MVKNRVHHGLTEAIRAECLYLLHGKTEQPGFHARRVSICRQLQAKLGMTKLRKLQSLVQKRTVLHSQADTNFRMIHALPQWFWESVAIVKDSLF